MIRAVVSVITRVFPNRRVTHLRVYEVVKYFFRILVVREEVYRKCSEELSVEYRKVSKVVLAGSGISTGRFQKLFRKVSESVPVSFEKMFQKV